jgi:tRNA/rRNA methyltransferase
MTAKLHVVLVRPRNPLNIGAAARALSNFGFPSLRLVAPYDVAWREARSAVGAQAVIRGARVYATLDEAIADCTLVVGTASVGHRALKLSVRRLELAARRIRSHPGPVALLFGSEKYGLSNDDLSRCHFLLRIPTRPEHESMNLGQAVALCLYELSRDAAPARPKAGALAAAATLARLDDALLDVLAAAGYPATESTPLQLRRLVRRMTLSEQDAGIWLGLLRQIRWKLEHPTVRRPAKAR